MSDKPFESLTDAWAETRATLHLYANAIGVIPRAHAQAHPKWWHVSLKVHPDGLKTNEMALPGGGSFNLRLDLNQHQVVLATSRDAVTRISMTDGLTGTEMGNRILSAVAGMGLSADYAREKFENDEPRRYDKTAASRYWTAVQKAAAIFNKHRDAVDVENKGIVQLWPHGFDLAFEWFGTRSIEYEEHGEIQTYPSQLNLGLFLGGTVDQQYFYSNPWPFEADKLTVHPLPAGAVWFTEGWQGTMLPYAELIGDKNGDARLLGFARAVYDIARPTLMA